MIYVSIRKKEYIKDIDNIINSVCSNNKIYYENIDGFNYKIIKKSKFIICDNEIEKIAYYLSFNKKVIVFNKDKTGGKKLMNRQLYTYRNNDELKDIIVEILNDKKKKNLNLLFVLLFTICIFFGYILVTNYQKYENKKEKSEEKIKKEKIKKQEEQARKLWNGKENIVLYGDSITDYYDLDYYYNNLPLINSGISGNQTKDLLDGTYDRVIKYNPTKVFILIGTNDIEFSDISDEKLTENIEEIADKIKKKRPMIKIYIESIYPVSKEENEKIKAKLVNKRENSRIKKINELIKKMCEEKKYTYIDMYSNLIDENDNLTLDYTVDGLHLSPNGYKVVTKELIKYIKE